MAVEFFAVKDDVVEMAQHLIELYHEDLQEARIGLLFRETASVSNGAMVVGKASKTTAQTRALLEAQGEEAPQFVIWLAYDYWMSFSPQKKLAVLDHELEHCYLDKDKEPRLRGHDIEEFSAIVRRHGLWRDELRTFADAVDKGRQLSLLPDDMIRERGWVKALDAALPPRRDFADEVAEAFEEEGILAK